jgi:hypothetical protein
MRRASSGNNDVVSVCDRCLWNGAVSPIADKAAAVCRWNSLRDHKIIIGYGAAATAPVESEIDRDLSTIYLKCIEKIPSVAILPL